MSPREPIVANSYWVDERLAAGQFPTLSAPHDPEGAIARFEDAGVRVFVDLEVPGKLPAYDAWLDIARRVSLGIPDRKVPTVELVEAALDHIDDARRAGECVYVHCHAGIGRTGLVIACWLIRHGLTPDEAIDRIRGLRQGYGLSPDSPETDAQRDFVRKWLPGA